MPELPEVETIRRIVGPQIEGRTILSVEIRNPQVIAFPQPETFKETLEGQTVSSIGRRGKYLWLCMHSGDRVIFHLRMTGLPLVTPTEYSMDKHTHLILHLSGDVQFRYIDQRRFGRFWLLRNDEPDNVTGMANLGLEPDDPRITADWLKDHLGSLRKPIKELLHDQSVIAGIGNIYSDEILFDAFIHPAKPCRECADEEWLRLAESIPRIIQWGINVENITPEEYLAGQGKEYQNAVYLKAYGRAGQHCTRCGAVMEKALIGGRSSCFCPVCQSMEK